MDFLGLRTLTLVDNALKLIEKTRGEKIDLDKLPLDDKETYELLQRGDAKGVFQFESDGIRELLKRLKPDTIHDIIACTALYRPGPLQGGMVDAYINRKHGREKPRYSASGHGRNPAGNARRHGVPRTGHAHPQPARRHRAFQRLRLHQGHQQEEAGHHRPAAGRISPRGHRNAAPDEAAAKEIFDLITCLRRLRLQ